MGDWWTTPIPSGTAGESAPADWWQSEPVQAKPAPAAPATPAKPAGRGFLERVGSVFAGPGTGFHEATQGETAYAPPVVSMFQQPLARPDIYAGKPTAPMNPVNIANLGVEDIVPDKMPGEKVARGVIGGTEDFATGVVNFLSVAGPAGHLPGGAARLISAGFSADMLWNAWNSIPAFRKEIKAGNVEGAVRVATGGLASAYLGQKLGRSATKGGAAVLKEAAAKAKSGITGDPLRVDPAVAATAPTAAPAVPSEVPPPAAPVTPLAASRTRVAARKAKLAPPPEAEAPAPTEVPPVASQAAGGPAPIVWNAGEAATAAAPKAAALSITIPPKPKFENSLEGKAAKAKFEAKERADAIKAKAKAEADALKAQAKAATDDLKQRAKDQKDAERSRQDTLKAQATEAKAQEEAAAAERKAKNQGMPLEDAEREIAEAIPKLTDAQLLDYVEEQKVERAAKPGEPETPLTSTQIAVADELTARKVKLEQSMADASRRADEAAARRAQPQPQVDEFSQEVGPTAEEMPQGAPPATAFRNPAGTYRFVSEEGGKVTFDFTNNKGNVARNVMPSAEWDRGAERREPILEPITVPEPEQATPVSPGPAKLRAAAEAAKAKTEAVKAKLTGEKVAEAPVAAPETAKSGIGVKAEAATTATPRAEADFETAYQKELYDFRNPREHAYPAMDLLKDWSTLDKTGTVTVRDLSNNDPGSMSTITTETRTEGRGAKRKTIGTYIVKTSQGKTYTFEWSGEDSKDWDAAKALARATGKYDNFQEIHGAMVNEGEYVGYHEKRYALREALKKAFPDKIIPEISTAVKVPKNPSLSDAITAVAESIPRNLWDLPTHGDIEPALKAFESRAKQSAEIIGREHPRVLELQKLVDDARAEAKQKQVLSEARETTAKENSRREIEASAKMDAEYYARFGTTDGESLPDLWKYAKLADWKEAKEGPETGRGAAVNERALREFDIEKKQLEPLDVSGIKFGKTDLDILREARLSPGGTVIPRRMSIGQEAEWKSRGWLDEGGSQLTELGERAALGLRQMDTRLQAGLPFSEYKPGTGRVPDPGENRFTANAPIPYKGDVYHTDGHILVLGPPPKYWSAPKTTPTSLPDVGRVMPKESGKTIAPIGFADKSSGIGPKTLVFFSNEVALDSKYFDYVSRLHSPDKWTSEGGKDNAVQAWKDGKRVGIIMPVKAEVPPGLTDLVGKPVATAPNPLAAASARAKEAVAARKAKLTGKESERGAISLTRADVAPAVEKLKRAGKEVGKFATDVYHGAQPLGSVLKREGNVGKGLMRTIETATDMGEVKGAGRIADMKEAGLDTLSREEQFNLHDALQGRAAPMNTKVEDVFDAARVVLEDTGLEMERRGITAQEKVTIPPGGPVPPGYKLNSRQKLSLIAAERANRPVTLSLERLAKARHDYYPQVMASVDALKSGHVRTDIAANIERMGLRPDRAQAEAFIDRWVQFLESGKRDDVLIKHLVDTGQVSTKPEALAALMSMRERALGRQKMGSMEYARQVNLPFYDPIPGRVLPNWVLKGSVFLERAGQLGQKGEVVKKAVYDIRKAGGDYVAVRDAAARILGAVREPDTGTNQALRAVRTWQGFKLALSAIPNAIQPFNVLLKSDAATLLAGVRGSMTKEGRAFGERSGAVLENVIQEALKNAGAEGEALSKFLKWNAFIPVEKNNRIISANAGRFYAQRLLNQLKLDPASKKARYRMEELGLRPDEILHRGSLSLGDQFMAAKKMSDITQFRSRPQDLPGVFSTSWGKVVFQFKNYSYQQGRIVFDSVVGEMRRGEYGEATKNLLVLATVFPLAGRAVSELRNAITGRKEDREAWDAYWGSVTQAGAAGLVGDLMQSGAWGAAAAALGGPTLADAADLINLVGKKDVGRSAAKLAFRRIPMIGPIFVNRVFPPKAKSSGSTIRKTY